ncbi:phage N-6-adenine-methyltransferase [Halobaculum magnesiiphilum]|uniref:Phage N-6-adenine-methyltransferase n=1 Tax=Halobaculum magnesiiphilum TaxID=1017351 RepID=A0A8T8WB84_9EURY|nr:phage N-6-adenine-methyltransferase [Halobaculum magnesiiphilum]QZP37097.1 phage N-6-adenine-methyltransferase [Halobaculum magnesiiphilum]
MSNTSLDLDLFTSSETDEWSTPPEFVRPLAEAVGGFDLDAAAGAERSPIADEAFTEDDDGLAQPWHGDVWLNPPYSAMDEWTPKVVSELQRPAVDSICYLVKGDSSTDWWQDAVEHAEAVAMLDSRLAFGDGDDSAPFASHVFVFGDAPGTVLDVLSRRATVFRAGHIHRETEQEQLVGGDGR